MIVRKTVYGRLKPDTKPNGRVALLNLVSGRCGKWLVVKPFSAYSAGAASDKRSLLRRCTDRLRAKLDAKPTEVLGP